MSYNAIKVTIWFLKSANLEESIIIPPTKGLGGASCGWTRSLGN
jgi:hypothetical protein